MSKLPSVCRWRFARSAFQAGLSVILTLGLATPLNAQVLATDQPFAADPVGGHDLRCETVPSAEQWAWLQALQNDDDALAAAARGGTQYIKVKAHVIGTESFTGYYRLQYLLESICRLNDQFAPTGLYFYLDLPVERYENDSWHDLTFSAGNGMMISNNVDDALNVYYAGNIESNTIAGYYSPGVDGVAMALSAASPNANTLAHEFGHFFSLPHTFYGWEWGTPSASAQERVDGSNCSSAADGFCDTPPDYAPYRWSCPTVGPFTDPDGVDFLVQDSFYMSYGGNACLAEFSPDQSAAMRANTLGPHAYTVGSIVPDFPNEYDTARLLEPADGSILVPPIGQRFRWSTVPGAVAYQVSIGFNGIFSAIAEEEIVTDTAWTAVRLPEDRNFYWRVKPLFEGNTCEPYGDVFTFRTGEIVSPTGFEAAVAALHPPFPNPVSSGRSLQVELPEPGAWTIRWLDASGRVWQSEAVEAPAKSLRLTAPTVPGWYVLALQGTDGRVMRSAVQVQ